MLCKDLFVSAVAVCSVWTFLLPTTDAFLPKPPSWGCTETKSTFVPPTFGTCNVVSSSSSESSTTLYISSWTSKGGRWGENTLKNPAERIQDYLKEPDAVEARSTIDGTCLVSGLVNAKDRTDQFLFDLLNHEDSAFEFSKILAYVDDSKFSKKRLLSRSARYTGLLDKLDFVQAPTPGALPTVEELEGVKSWLAVVGVTDDASGITPTNADKIQQVLQIAETAKYVSTLENIAILIMNAVELDATESLKIVSALKETGKVYTIVCVGTIEDRPEGQTWYQYGEFGLADSVLPSTAVFSREESYRMITELLQLESGSNKALTFGEVYNPNITEAKLIKGLREAGYARPQEIDHMIREGPAAYKAAIDEFLKKYPDAQKGYTTNAWWEAEEFQKSRRSSAERTLAQEKLVKDTRTMDIEEIAKEWAKREYFRQSMAGTINDNMSEEEFTKSVWDRAMFEGDQKYRIMKGEAIDEEAELATFKAQQERKQLVMLKRAKEEMKEILRGTDSGVGQDDFDDEDDEDKSDKDDK